MSAINWTTVVPPAAFYDYGKWRVARFNEDGNMIDETPSASQLIVSFYSKQSGYKWCTSEEFFAAMNNAPAENTADLQKKLDWANREIGIQRTMISDAVKVLGGQLP